jgi:uncharacterized protein with HEPN domain
MYKKDEAILLIMLEAIDKILEFSSLYSNPRDFANDYLRFDATMMNFIIIGEMVGKLSEDIKQTHQEMQWRKIYAFRNFVAHYYFGIYDEEVWQIIQNDIPLLKEQINKLLK